MPFQYGEAFPFENGFAEVILKGEWLVIDKKGEVTD